jgi:hypothetical protein
MSVKYLSQDGVLYLMQRIRALFVAKEAGKGLSTNDLTNELKQKILDAGDSSFSGNYDDLYNKPTLFSGAYEDLTGKPTIPSAVGQLANDAGYQTAAQVAAAIGTAGHLERVIVAELPAVGVANEHAIYMLDESGGGSNRYTEWMVIAGAWEQIGSSEADLTDYLKVSDMVAVTNSEIDNIIAAVFA